MSLMLLINLVLNRILQWCFQICEMETLLYNYKI